MKYITMEDNETKNVVTFQYMGEVYCRTYKDNSELNELFDNNKECLLSDLDKDLDDGDDSDEVFEAHICNICNISYATEVLLGTHIQRKHKGLICESKHKCKFCSYSTNEMGRLKRHEMTHTGEKTHECPECGKKFAQKQFLNVHLHIHDKERPKYDCDSCSKSFTSKCNLTRHKQLHEGNRPFICSTCGSTFSKSYNLHQHEKIHNGNKPFCCTICDCRFAQKSNLKKHVVRKHTEKNRKNKKKNKAAKKDDSHLHGAE